MSRIHENLPVRQFEQPDSVETAYVCKKSGLLAVDGVCTEIREAPWLTRNILQKARHRPRAAMCTRL